MMALPVLFYLVFCLVTFCAFLIEQPLALVLSGGIFGLGYVIYQIPKRPHEPD